MNSKWTSLNPPPPGDISRSSTLKGSKDKNASSMEEGKKILNLLKTYERELKDRDGEAILDTLSTMESLYLRRGLLEYDTERAYEMQNKMNDPNVSSQSSGGGRGSNGKKRRRGGGGNGSSGGIASILGIDAGNSNNLVGKEAYVLSNLCRILLPVSSSGDTDLILKYPPIIVNATCKVLIAICNHCSNHLPSSTATLEHSMIVSISSQLLSGISKTSNLLLAAVNDKGDNQDCTQFYKALTACCNCASIVISLTGNRLSRNAKVMENVQHFANAIIWQDDIKNDDSDENLIVLLNESAATLLSTIPLAGNSSGVSPSTLWTRQLHSICKELLTTLLTFYPSSRRISASKRKLNADVGNEKVAWIEEVKENITSQAERIKILTMRIDGYMSILLSFLRMEKYDHMDNGLTCCLPIKCLLDILEQMLSFSPKVENKFLITKPRLRDISIEGGLLSPKAAMTIANCVKYQGHILFHAINSSLSNSSLIHGKRIIGIALSSLQSCSSYALRMVIDPVSVSEKNGGKKWLQSSVSLRSMSIQSFACVMQRLGSNAIVSQTESITKGIIFIVGFLLEQISNEKGDPEKDMEDEHWGTALERAKLVETCVEALATCVSIFGGYLPFQSREMIESVTSTCLEHIRAESNGSIYCNNATTKAAILDLGINCISTPWSDGSASSITGMVRQTATYLRFDRDRSVSSTSYTALAICNCLATPRAPPLVIVTRDKNVEALNTGMSSSFSKAIIEEGISNMKENIIEKKIKSKKKAISDSIRAKEKSTIRAQINSTKETAEVKIVQSETKTFQESNADVELNTSLKIQQQHFPEKKDEAESKVIVDHVEKEKPPSPKEEPLVADPSDDEDDDLSDADFPMIVDCDPDDEDME